MSTNNECEIIEDTEGQWWYVLEDYNAPKNAWDWREYATAYGSFTSEDTALKHLDDNHSNPGGHYTSQNVDISKDELLKRLTDEARKRPKRRSYGTRYRWS